MKTSAALDLRRSAVRGLAGRYRASNPRVFGSVLHGTGTDGSDIDLLVDVLQGATLFDPGGRLEEREDLPGVPVDLLPPADLPPQFRNEVPADAITL